MTPRHTHTLTHRRTITLTLPDCDGLADRHTVWWCACNAPDAWQERSYLAPPGPLPSLATLDAIRRTQTPLPAFALATMRRARVQPVNMRHQRTG